MTSPSQATLPASGIGFLGVPWKKTDARYSYRLGYALFVLVTAALFIRPGEVVTSLESWPIFEVLILACLMASLPAVWEQLKWSALKANPAKLCVVALLPAIIFSEIANGSLYGARTGTIDFLKVLIYFLLLVSLVNSFERLRSFLKITALLILATASLAVLRYYNVVQVDSMQVLVRHDGGIDEETGQGIAVQQLQASGLFSDPNDFSLVLVTAMLVMLNFIMVPQSWIKRLLWIPPMALVSFAFALTRSRGGFLSMLAGLFVLLTARLGWKRTLPLAVVLLPIILLLFGGRQTDITMDADSTMGSRVRLWREGMTYFKGSPVYGIGYNMYAENAGLVAHNSYIHTYAELGFIGGTLFLGAFLLPMMALKGMHKPGVAETVPGLGHLHSCLLAVLAAYAAGLFSLSRPYACSTYLILGVGAVICLLIKEAAPGLVPGLSGKLSRQLIVCSVLWLAFIYVFARFIAA